MALPSSIASDRAEAASEFLCFRLGVERCAVELAQVREVVKVPPITEVPRAPEGIVGVMMQRGEVMPVFDLHGRLRLAPSVSRPNRWARVVIVDVGGEPAGVLVDAVEQVLRLRPSQVEDPPAASPGGCAVEYLTGLLRCEEKSFVVLDLRAILGVSSPGPGGQG